MPRKQEKEGGGTENLQKCRWKTQQSKLEDKEDKKKGTQNEKGSVVGHRINNHKQATTVPNVNTQA